MALELQWISRKGRERGVSLSLLYSKLGFFASTEKGILYSLRTYEEVQGKAINPRPISLG